jgi:hypothetical protein
MYSAEVVSAIARIQCRRRRSDERGTYRRRTASGKGGVWQRWSLRFTANRLSRRKLQAPWTCMCEQTVTLAKKTVRGHNGLTGYIDLDAPERIAPPQ